MIFIFIQNGLLLRPAAHRRAGRRMAAVGGSL
jgi:hypothetical protein